MRLRFSIIPSKGMLRGLTIFYSLILIYTLTELAFEFHSSCNTVVSPVIEKIPLPSVRKEDGRPPFENKRFSEGSRIKHTFTVEAFININSVEDWKREEIGLNKGQINALEKFITLSGFRSEEEIRKLSFIESDWYDRHCHQFYCSHKEELEFNLNQMDTLELQELDGVGPILSKRIIDYRNSLGGFYAKTQLKEVYGIEDSLVETWTMKFIFDSSDLKPFPYPTDSFQLLLSHPYISYEQARELFRFQNKMDDDLPFEDWILLNSFNKTDLNRLRPYVQTK